MIHIPKPDAELLQVLTTAGILDAQAAEELTPAKKSQRKPAAKPTAPTPRDKPAAKPTTPKPRDKPASRKSTPPVKDDSWLLLTIAAVWLSVPLIVRIVNFIY